MDEGRAAAAAGTQATGAVPLVELWRGGLREGVHRGHAVIVDGAAAGDGILAAWGDPTAVIFPRSSCKMIQALPLVESGAAERAGLRDEALALACASHNGARLHVERVAAWLAALGLGEADLRCGSHLPRDPEEARRLTCADEAPCQLHNNCSGKHAGFLTLARETGGGPDYVDPDHPVQRSVSEATGELCGGVEGWGVDGCSAPNFAVRLGGLARAMARFAAPRADRRGAAMRRLVGAMVAHPALVAGEGRACTALMRATGGAAAVKTGAEGVFVGILPGRGIGLALKIEDGGMRAAEAAVTALLVRLGVLDAGAPVVGALLTGPQRNWRGIETGGLRLAEGFADRPL